MQQYGKRIAELRNLTDPEKYTSHCFRRSAASQLAEEGATATESRTAGNWKSKEAAMGYVHSSLRMKRNLSHMLGGTKNVVVAAPEAASAMRRLIEETGHKFSNANGCTFKISCSISYTNAPEEETLLLKLIRIRP